MEMPCSSFDHCHYLPYDLIPFGSRNPKGLVLVKCHPNTLLMSAASASKGPIISIQQDVMCKYLIDRYIDSVFLSKKLVQFDG